jgi:hypothetical protein
MTLTSQVTAFFDDYAAALDAFDVEALLDCLAFPHLIATRDGSHFFEDDAEALVNLERLIDEYRRHGVFRVVRLALTIEPLPDDAARATVEWRLEDAQGNQILHFPTIYTLAQQDGDWAIVAIDAQAENDAWAGAGWA